MKKESGLVAAESFAKLAMEASVQAVLSARAGSPTAEARAKLGSTRVIDVLTDSIRMHCKRVLVHEREQTLEMLSVPGLGQQAILADLIAGVLADLKKAADTCSDMTSAV